MKIPSHIAVSTHDDSAKSRVLQQKTSCSPHRWQVSLTPGMVLQTVLLPLIVSFITGWVLRCGVVYSFPPVLEPSPSPTHGSRTPERRQAALPLPVLPAGQEPPLFVYTSKTFADDTVLRSSDSVFTTRDPFHQVDPTSLSVPHDNHNSTMFFPTCSQLSIDINEVDETFLNAEEQLARALLQLVQRQGWTIWSYHCHELVPMGVTCMGMLPKSHISVRTWPGAHTILLDLFICDGSTKPLVEVLPDVHELFAITIQKSTESSKYRPPGIQWHYHVNRGLVKFENNNSNSNTTTQENESVDMLELQTRWTSWYKEFSTNA